MTWKNHGVYSLKTFKKNDVSTWTWQLDHIIPDSTFICVDINDEECKKSWALTNLRPLRSDKNILDGARRIRHKKEK